MLIESFSAFYCRLLLLEHRDVVDDLPLLIRPGSSQRLGLAVLREDQAGGRHDFASTLPTHSKVCASIHE
jgi:hypothetical protein